MKIILFCLLLVSFQVYSQSKEPQFKNYIAVSSGINSAKQPGFSIEVGKWGIVSPLTFSLDYDLNYDRNFKVSSSWIGPKLYYSVYSKDKFSAMLYASTKFALNVAKPDNFIIETGVCLNYNLSGNIILGFSEYFQSSSSYTLQPNIGISLIRLF